MLILDMQKANKKVIPRKTAPAYNDGKVVGIIGGGMVQIATNSGKIKIAKSSPGTQSVGGSVNFSGGLVTSVPGRILPEIEWREV